MDDEISIYKVVFVGESGTGAKTSLINRIVYNSFDPEQISTLSPQYVSKSFKNNLGNKIKLGIWDTAGQEKYRSLVKIFLKDSHCIILGYDITHKRSFDQIREYHYNKVKEIVGDFPLIYLVANKIDLNKDKMVSENEASNFAKEKNIKFFQVSAKTGEGVDNLVKDIVNSITDKFILKKEVKIKK